jgi:hypothetical protein
LRAKQDKSDSLNNYRKATSVTQNYVLAGLTSGAGSAAFRALVAADIPTLNQSTTGSANSLKSSQTTGLMTFSGMGAGQTRQYIVPDADATILTNAAAVTTAQGGTNVTSAGTAGNILKSNGTNWASAGADSAGFGVLLYGKRGTGDSSSVAGTAGKYITPTMVAAGYRTNADSSATSGTAGKYITPTMVATTYATKADTQNQIRKYTVLMQAGVGSDSVCVSTSYKIPMGISTGFTVDSVMIIQMRTGGSLPSVRYRVNFGTDISAAGTLVDTTTATSYTTVTAQGGANINGTAAIPPGAIVWLDFPTVTVAPKTFLVVLLGHRSP